MGLPTIEQAGFGEPDAAYDYRPLRDVTPGKPAQRGWDVYALQTGFLALGYNLPRYGADGYLGAETGAVIWRFQRDTRSEISAGLKQDGIAGIITQREVLIRVGAKVAASSLLPDGMLYGQLEKESGFLVGNHTALYTDGPAKGTYDIGCAQRNVKWATTTCRFYFDVGRALTYLVNDPERGLRPRKNKYYGRAGARTHRRAWELAQGSWHAPSYADIASNREDSYLPQYVEDYIDRVAAYVTNYTP